MTLAALGPKMLDLSFERTLGTHPYFTPACAHEVRARAPWRERARRAGAGRRTRREPDAAKIAAREYAAFYLGLRNYTNNLLPVRLHRGGLRRRRIKELIDAVVPQGSAVQLANAIQAHLDAGADHVCVQVVGAGSVPVEQWRALAEVADSHN